MNFDEAVEKIDFLEKFDSEKIIKSQNFMIQKNNILQSIKYKNS